MPYYSETETKELRLKIEEIVRGGKNILCNDRDRRNYSYQAQRGRKDKTPKRSLGRILRGTWLYHEKVDLVSLPDASDLEQYLPFIRLIDEAALKTA